MNCVKDKIELVQATFQKGKEMADQEHDFKNLNKLLLGFPKEFISVAYEGASMSVAIKSIQEYGDLDHWNVFYQNFGLEHSIQFHVGLGWAFSAMNKNFSDFNLKIEPLLKYRVLDGYGYSEGFLKRRRSIRQQEFPSHFNNLELRAYNQGLGRSLWYISQGEADKLRKLMDLFPENRQSDLWRGVGIAVAYVGGVDNSTLNQLVNNSNSYISSFKCGIGLLIQSRTKANTVMTDTESICNQIFNKDCVFVNDELMNIEQSMGLKTDVLYFDLINKIEQEIYF